MRATRTDEQERPIDIQGLFLLTAEVEAILGTLLLLFWLQNLPARALAWWGWALVLRAFSISAYVKYDSTSQLAVITAANAILLASYALIWSGARAFEGRPPIAVPLITATMLWLVSYAVSRSAHTAMVQATLNGGIMAAFLMLAAYEFCRGRRSQRLRLRWPAVGVLFASGAVFLLQTPSRGWAGIYYVFSGMATISQESLLATIGTAFILYGMTKERSDASRRDPERSDPTDRMEPAHRHQLA